MFKLTKEFRFEASHQLRGHDGKCKDLHGHSYRGELTLAGQFLYSEGPKKNMVIDYADIKKFTKMIEEKLDHKHLNEIFENENVTAEFLAQWIYDFVKEKLNEPRVHVDRVVVWETDTSRCEFAQG